MVITAVLDIVQNRDEDVEGNGNHDKENKSCL